MALVTATITVDFIANYAGPHRVCWRIQGSGNPYDCNTVVNCAGGATTCQAIINPTVNTTSCDGPVIFEGYIQAACEDILSTSGRLLWSAPFVPNQVCDKFNITCELGAVIGVPVPVKGSLYLDTDTITVTRAPLDTGIVDAVITLDTVGNGVIDSITSMLAGGIDYVALDTITITGGSGVGATIRVDTVAGGTGAILTHTLIANGSNYYGVLAFDITSGAGSGANFEVVEGVDWDQRGSLQTFTIVNGGEYSLEPTLGVVTGTGSGAVFGIPPLGGCPQWDNVGADCIGGDQVDILDQTLEVGSTFSTCLEGGLATPIPARYLVDESGCCIAEDSVNTVCTDHHIENVFPSVGPVDVHITRCGGDDEIFSAPLGTTALCLVTGGWIDPFEDGVTITDIGSPCT